MDVHGLRACHWNKLNWTESSVKQKEQAAKRFAAQYQLHYHVWNKKPSYRQHIARQLRTQSNNAKQVTEMTFKGHPRSLEMSRFDTADRIWFPITVPW